MILMHYLQKTYNQMEFETRSLAPYIINTERGLLMGDPLSLLSLQCDKDSIFLKRINE